MNSAVARRRGRWRWLVGAFLGLVLVALAVLLPNADTLLRDQLLRLLAARLAMPVALEEARLEDLAAQPRLRLRGLRLGPAERPLLSIGAATLSSASLQAVLAGKVEVLALSQVELNLARRADGQLNLVPLMALSGPPGESATPLPEVSIEDLRIILDPSLGAQGELRVAQLQAGAGARAGEIRLAVEGLLALSMPLDAHAEFSLQTLLQTAPQPALEGLSLAFAGRGQGWRADRGRLEIARLANAADGSWSIAGLAAAAHVESPHVASALLAGSVPAATLAGGRLAVPALGLAVNGRQGGVEYQGEVGLLDLAGSAQALHAKLARITLAASMADGSALSLQALGALRSEDDLGALRGEALALELLLPHPSQPARQVQLTGIADVGADLARRHARLEFRGRFDASRVELRGDLASAREPPLELRARIDQLDLDAYFGGDRPAGGAASDWASLPVALDVEVGQLRRQQVGLRDVRLHYRPAAPQRRAE